MKVTNIMLRNPVQGDHLSTYQTRIKGRYLNSERDMIDGAVSEPDIGLKTVLYVVDFI